MNKAPQASGHKVFPKNLRTFLSEMNGFVPQKTKPERLLAVADSTLDVDMFRAINVQDGGKVVAVLPEHLFEDPQTAAHNWRSMFKNIRNYLEAESAQTKLTVEKIEHNGADVAAGKTDIAEVIVTTKPVHGGEPERRTFRIGRLRDAEGVSSALSEEGKALSPEALSRIGMEGVRRSPERFFQCLFGAPMGGGRHNVAANLSAISAAVSGEGGSVETVTPEGFTPDHSSFTRVSLVCKDVVTAQKTILRLDPDAATVRRMEEAARAIAGKDDSVTDIIATSRADEGEEGSFETGEQFKMPIHALVAKPSLDSLRGVRTAVFNSEIGELGKILSEAMEHARKHGDADDAEESGMLLQALKDLEKRSKAISGHIAAERAHMKIATEEEGKSGEGYAEEIRRLERERDVVENDRMRAVKDALLLIGDHIDSDRPSDLLVTNGPNGLVGLAQLYDFKIIFGGDVLEDDHEVEKSLVDRLDGITGGLISMKVKDTTGCGDSCMSAWMAAQETEWKRAREAFYFREVGLSKIHSSNYKTACAYAEAFWRFAFVKTLSGVMFRCSEPNLSNVPAAAIREVVAFVDEKTSAFIRGDLYREFLKSNGLPAIRKNTFGFWLYHSHKVSNPSLPSSNELIAERVGVRKGDILREQGRLSADFVDANGREPGALETSELYRKATANLVNGPWRDVAKAMDRGARMKKAWKENGKKEK